MYAPSSSTVSSPEINTTPLIDVLLVLLIIFMVAAPLTTQRLSLPLPSKGQQQIEPLPTRDVDLRVDSGDTLMYLDGVPIDLAELARQLRQPETGAASAVKVRSEADVPCAEVVRTLAALRKVGIEQLRVEDLPRL